MEVKCPNKVSVFDVKMKMVCKSFNLVYEPMRAGHNAEINLPQPFWSLSTKTCAKVDRGSQPDIKIYGFGKAKTLMQIAQYIEEEMGFKVTFEIRSDEPYKETYVGY